MKRIILKLLITVLFIVAPLAVLAQAPDNAEPGLSGSLLGGAFILQTNSQLYVDGSNRRTSDLDGPADFDEKIQGLASINLRYQFEGGTAFYAGNPLEVEEELYLAAGVSQPIGHSTLDVAVVWIPINEVWKNPYQLGRSREKSDMNAYGLRVKLQEIAGSPWEAIYNIKQFDIKDDEIGDLENDLKRDGYSHELGVKYTLPIQQGSTVSFDVSYTYGDIEGRSNRYHGIKAGVLLKRVQPPWVLSGIMSGFHNQYEHPHSLFGTTRQETGFFSLAQVTRLNLLGVKRLFASFMAGYGLSDANIDFFDSQTIGGLAILGINF